MKTVPATTMVLICIALAACSARQLFPPEVMKDVDPNFDFTRWKMAPNQAAGHKVVLGGRIIQADMKDDRTTIVVAHLPIVEHPAYGPKETGRPTSEFAVEYQGTIDRIFLQRGNRLMVVGTTRPATAIPVDELLRSLPTVSAACVHVWNTGGRDIADFPGFGAGYEPLQEQTFCAGSR
ncbi:MAG TPA: Slp family lipoprotein [Nitrospira sp.]|nr:Slp family lipoprotein [Nitrospira sp.]